MNFDLIEIIPAKKIENINSFLKSWFSNGYHADMAYLKISISKRINPQKNMKDAKTIIILAKNYYVEDQNTKECKKRGYISKYARFRDYHKTIEKMLKEFCTKIYDAFPGSNIKSYVDYGPILEKGFAQKSGIGFIGKNTTLITPKFGSWVFLGSIITDISVKDLAAHYTPNHATFRSTTAAPSRHSFSASSRPPTSSDSLSGIPAGSLPTFFLSPPGYPSCKQKLSCGECQKCLKACPTGALVAPYTLDARKCISYLTIENRGPIPLELREKIGNNLFGCDKCQLVCPFNQSITYKNPKICNWEQRLPSDICPTEILKLRSNDEFIQRFAGTPIIRAKFHGMIRNACVVAGNLRLKKALPHLKHWQKSQNPIISEHAEWAINKINLSH